MGTSTGGGFSSHSNTTVTNSIFTNNSASSSGGGFISITPAVTNSIFTNNSAGNDGGGFSTQTYPSIPDLGSSSSSSIAIAPGVTNSIFTNNSAGNNGGGFWSYALPVTNSLFSSNSSGIHIGGGSIISNNVFLDNNSSDINGSGIFSHLNNNYLDINNVGVSVYVSNNIFDGVTLGFVDEVNGDYNLTVSSDLIDAGTTTITGLTLPTTDLNGNVRIVGGSIDIGPYEFSTTKPTLAFFTFSGVAKELNELTFSVDYTLADGRSISHILYDYTNNGSWSSIDTHTFNAAGTYTVNVKVTDSEGEFSSTSISVTVAPLPFADMTDEQKLVKAIDATYYDEILAIIESSKNTSNTSGYELGTYDGKQYVQENLEEFSLVSKPTIEVTSNSIEALGIGWTLASTPFEITDMSVFDNVTLVWIFDSATASWSAYSSNADMQAAIVDATSISTITSIPAGSGVWVLK